MQSQVGLSITMKKASGDDRIWVELFQILKDDAVKVLHSVCQQIWKIQQWPQDWKKSLFILIPKKSSDKECSKYCTVAVISHASKVMLKILQARLQQYMKWKLPDVPAGFWKGRGITNQIANICWIMEKAREFQLSYLKSSKMIQLKCCTQYVSKFGKLSSVYRTGKGQFSFQS